MKNSLEQEAEKRDKSRQLDIESQEQKAKELRDYRRNLAKFNAWAIRTEDSPPDEYDIKKLEHCMHYFKK